MKVDVGPGAAPHVPHPSHENGNWPMSQRKGNVVKCRLCGAHVPSTYLADHQSTTFCEAGQPAMELEKAGHKTVPHASRVQWLAEAGVLVKGAAKIVDIEFRHYAPAWAAEIVNAHNDSPAFRKEALIGMAKIMKEGDPRKIAAAQSAFMLGGAKMLAEYIRGGEQGGS